MVYPHKWSPVSYRSSAGHRKFTGQRLTFYRWVTQPTSYCYSVFLSSWHYSGGTQSPFVTYSLPASSLQSVIDSTWSGSNHINISLNYCNDESLSDADNDNTDWLFAASIMTLTLTPTLTFLLLQAQRASWVIVPALFATRETRSVGDRPTPLCQNIRTTDY